MRMSRLASGDAKSLIQTRIKTRVELALHCLKAWSSLPPLTAHRTLSRKGRGLRTQFATICQ